MKQILNEQQLTLLRTRCAVSDLEDESVLISRHRVFLVVDQSMYSNESSSASPSANATYVLR